MSPAIRPAPETCRIALACLLAVGAVLRPRAAIAEWPASPYVNVPVATAGLDHLNPRVESDGGGGAIVCWVDRRTGAYDVYAQRLAADGSVAPGWPFEGLPVCTAVGTQGNVRPTASTGGSVLFVWQDARTGTTDIYAQRVLPGGALDPAWPDSGLAVCTATGSQNLPEALSDMAGGAIAVWIDSRNGSTSDLYAQHVRAGGTVDPNWPVDGVAVCTAANTQSVARLASDGAGGAFVVWNDFRGGTTSDIYAHHVLASGAMDPTWPVDGLGVCTAAGNQQVPAIVTDGSGGMFIAWQDFRGGATSDIYTQHVLGSGQRDPNWMADGLAICSAAGDQKSLSMVATGVGSAIVVWMDYRGGLTSDLYAQRVIGWGDPDWPVNGRAVCAAAGDQSNPVLCPDGYGGAIFTWYDKRNPSNWDVYAQHVLFGGEVDPSWPSDGSALCLASYSQQDPWIMADGSGGAIVAWNDHRTNDGYTDVYTQRVRSDGTLGGVVVGVPGDPRTGVSLGHEGPNPWMGGELELTVELLGGSPATLELLDVAGRRLALRDLGGLGAGRHAVSLDPGKGLGAGVYFVRLREGEAIRSKRIVALR